ncbi:MAG: hypothetical protein HZA93_28015 [Verrucomicrobia bacterium]|nr:hypothetical protein [Verrucomicrobiota bacterium]
MLATRLPPRASALLSQDFFDGRLDQRHLAFGLQARPEVGPYLFSTSSQRICHPLDDKLARLRHVWCPGRYCLASLMATGDARRRLMTAAVLFIIIALVAAGCLAGWGRVAASFTGAALSPWPLRLAVGIATVIFVGGCLNAFRVAVPLAIDLIVVAGVVLALAGVWRERSKAMPKRSWSAAGKGMAVVVAGLVVALFLTPQQTFNWQDDFERYFSYPVRMLATGTLGGNPLGYIGVDTLGGQAFLQALVVRYLPLEYLGSAETAVALLLCLLLAVDGTAGWRGAVVTVAAQATLLVIDPQIANVSSVFTTAVLVMAACFLGRTLFEPTVGRWSLLLPGLVYAGLIALKTINVIFVAGHLGALVIVGLVNGRSARELVGKIAGIAGWTGFALLPWWVVHAPTYLAAIGVRHEVPAADVVREPFGLFSLTSSVYGVPPILFTVVALGGLAVVSAWQIGVWRKRESAEPAVLAGIAAGGAALVAYVGLVAVLAPLIFGQVASIRYCSPMLIGAVPAMVVLLGAVETRGPMRHHGAMAGALALTALVAFLPSAKRRWEQIVGRGSLLVFADLAGSDYYAAYNDWVLRGKVRQFHETMQALVPAGEPIVVWTTAPFWLNFARNPIYNTSQHGLGLPRKTWPQARYVIWQYRGAAVFKREQYVEWLRAPGASDRISAARALEFIDRSERRKKEAEILFDDGGYVLMRLRE